MSKGTKKASVSGSARGRAGVKSNKHGTDIGPKHTLPDSDRRGTPKPNVLYHRKKNPGN